MNQVSENKLSTSRFSQLLQSPKLLHNLVEEMGFKDPTPIQEAVIPSILEGKDLYAGAKTGSGKTVAFLAPLGQLLESDKVKKALVLSPTRELALQIDEEAMEVFGKNTGLVSMPLYGGVPLDQQLRALKIHNPRLYVATPGRMIDFISEGCLPLADIDVCVLDEADRMCDMGFSPQVVEILNTLPNLKQVMMFSATLPKEATMIMERFLNNPTKIQVDAPEEAHDLIEHHAILIDRRHKLSYLNRLLRDEVGSGLIFTRTRKGADRLYDSLRQKRHRAGILHAGFSMGEREKTIRAYREGKLQFLVATDVAARGLDVDHVTHVIHYDLPESPEDYIHRSGRSGRAGRRGISIALIDNQNSAQRRQLESISKSLDIQVRDAQKTSGPKERPKRNEQKSEAKSNSKRTPQKSRPKKQSSRSTKSTQAPTPKKTILQSAKKFIKNIFGSKS